MKKNLALLCMEMFFPLLLFGNSLSPVLEVFNRVAPWMKGKVEVCEMEPSADYIDAYELSMHKGKLRIKATSIPAAGMGFNYYLKYFCHRNFALVGMNMTPVNELPQIKGKVFRSTTAEYRHIFNFCTQNYTAAFWKWTEWQKMIDFMVLNGVNLSIATVGLEKVWYNTLERMNYTEEEIMAFLPGPAFNAWHMMANMEGWGGPITQNLINKRSTLAKKILNQMRKMEINPIYMSFYGMVPTTLKDKHPEARIIPQGRWAGGFVRPDILSPTDSLYGKMADIYYRELKKLYGDFKFFAGEPFHEGGNRQGIDASELSAIVLNKIRHHFPSAQWVLQGWSGNPTSQFLSGVAKKGDVLVWDFRGELWAEWELRKGYEGYPFLWGAINNYGETPGLYGRLERFVEEYFRAKETYPDNMAGLGVSPEGVYNNPINFDFMFEIPWHKERYSVKEWLEDYVKFRYGRFDKSAYDVWKVLLQTAYSSETDSCNVSPISNVLPSIVGNAESTVCAPPSLNSTSASSWGTSFVFYDSEKMKTLIPSLIKSSDTFSEVDAFRYDMVNITRQLLSNEFKKIYALLQESVKSKDLKAYDSYVAGLLSIMDDMDELLNTRSEFMVGKWIKAARDFGDSNYEKQLAEWNLRSQVTYWGPDNIHTDLRDYAHKEWAGIIKDIYRPRWATFFKEVRANVFEGVNTPNIHPTQISLDWSRLNNKYPYEPVGDAVQTSVKYMKKLQANEYLGLQ